MKNEQTYKAFGLELMRQGRAIVTGKVPGAQQIAGFKLIVVGAVFLFIGLFVVSAVDQAIDRSNFTASANSTYDSIFNNAMAGFNMAGISLIVIGAVIVLGLLDEI